MTKINLPVAKMWDKVFELDGAEITFIHNGAETDLTAAIDDVEELAEILYSNLKITSEIAGITVKIRDLPAFPQKGDKFRLDGKTYVLVPVGGQDYWQWTDTARYTLKIAGYKE